MSLSLLVSLYQDRLFAMVQNCYVLRAAFSVCFLIAFISVHFHSFLHIKYIASLSSMCSIRGMIRFLRSIVVGSIVCVS